MGLLCFSFVLEPIRVGNLILLGKKLTYFSKSSKYTTGNKVGLRRQFWIQKLPKTNFNTEVELPPVRNIYCRRVSYICQGELNYFQFTTAIFCRNKNFWIRKATNSCFWLKNQCWIRRCSIISTFMNLSLTVTNNIRNSCIAFFVGLLTMFTICSILWFHS